MRVERLKGELEGELKVAVYMRVDRLKGELEGELKGEPGPGLQSFESMSRSIGSAMGTFCMDTFSILRPTHRKSTGIRLFWLGFYAKWFIFQNYFHSHDKDCT